MARHGKRPGECAARLRIRPRLADNGAFPAGRGKPLPYGEMAANSSKVVENMGAAARNAEDGVPYRGECGFAVGGGLSLPLLPGAPYNGRTANSPNVSKKTHRSCWAVGTPAPTGKCCEFAGGGGLTLVLLPGAPYNGGTADSPNVCDNLTAAAGASGRRPLHGCCMLPVKFLPPAGEGGIRRSPARRMTEEGEPDRQQTAKSFAYARMRGKNSGSDLSSPLFRARTEQRGRHGLPPALG